MAKTAVGSGSRRKGTTPATDPLAGKSAGEKKELLDAARKTDEARAVRGPDRRTDEKGHRLVPSPAVKPESDEALAEARELSAAWDKATAAWQLAVDTKAGAEIVTGLRAAKKEAKGVLNVLRLRAPGAVEIARAEVAASA